jgi:capsular polysaccharide biosynthesis protein
MMQISSNFSKKKKEKIIVFGTGSAAIKYVKGVRKTHQVVGYLDNNTEKHGKKLNDIPIFPPDQIKQFPRLSVIVASSFFDEIYAQLKENKNFKHTNIIFYRSLKTDDPLLERTTQLITNKISDLICNTPQFLIPFLRQILKISSKSLVNIYTLENGHKYRILILRPEQKNISVGPRFLERAQNKTNVTIPPVGLYQFYNCQISILSRAFKIDHKNIIVEKIHTISDKITKYNKGHVIHHYQNKLALVRNEQTNHLQKGILINGYYDKNYYHWIIDIIPQLQYLQELPDQYKDFPILISDMAQKIKSITELLSLFSRERKIIFLPSINDYVVENLLVISSPNRCCPRIIGSAWALADYTYSRIESIHYIRDLVLKKCNDSNESFPKKVFLAPSMKHRKYNQDDVFNMLDRFGFVKVNPEKMGLIEQALIFSRAEIIVGPTGATWANIIFAQKGANALCWMAEEWGDFSAFSNLAAIVEVNLDYLTYAAGVDDHIELFSQEYVIDQQKIEKWVKELTTTN